MATTITGVYLIRNLLNGKVYVGSTVNVDSRRNRHFLDLEKNIHPNAHLQNSFNKHGLNAFVFEILEVCVLGIKRSEETKRRLSASLIGTKKSPEARKKMALAKIGTSFRKGKKASPETRKRISEAKKGTVVTEETRMLLSKMRIGNKNALGFKQSPETIKKRMDASKATREKNKALKSGVT